MRLLLALLGLMLVGAAPDWSRTVTRTPAGAYVVGNPAAKVRLVEYMSYTCPHCGHFAVEGAPKLIAGYVSKGQVAFEIRNAVRDPLDLAVALAARCGGATRFYGNHDAVFAAQAGLLAKAEGFQQANGAALAKLPADARLKAFARGSGLAALMQRRGIAPAQLDACLTGKAAQAPVLAMTNDAWAVRKISGTPTFFIADTAIDANAWEGVEPLIQAALK